MSNTILITGANRGIGLSLAQLAKQRGDEVIAVCRQSSSDLESMDIRIISGIDVTNDKDLETLSNKLPNQSLDMLINNAGLLCSSSLSQLNVDDIRRQFEVNSLAPLRVTQALLPALKSPSKIGIVTSRMGSIEDNTSGGSYGYRMSKVAANMAGVSLAQDLKAQNISVAILHPGYVRTEMTHHHGFIDPPEAAQGLLDRMDELTLESSGSFWHSDGTLLPW